MTEAEIRKLCIRLGVTEDRLYEALSAALDELDERRCGVLTLNGVDMNEALARLSDLRGKQFAEGSRDSLLMGVRCGRLERP